MTIVNVRTWREALPLTRPYTIATKTIDAVDLFFVTLETQAGIRGLGCASPGIDVTGESPGDCARQLEPERLCWLQGADPAHLGGLLRRLEADLHTTPAACAAVDMALFDLFGRLLDRPLVDVLGRCHDVLPTSITIGIKDVAATLEEGREYRERGFVALKVKTGHDVALDVERVIRLRELVGDAMTIRVDANQGWSVADTLHFFEATAEQAVEFVEQPLGAAALDELLSLPPDLRRRIAADESLLSAHDAFRLACRGATGIFNIKLMKCGGIAQALRIGGIAGLAGIDLMWGCMDESVISIAAALHAAFACPRTRYLDLDGSLDLARDAALGGFDLQDGLLRTVDAPGLGVAAR